MPRSTRPPRSRPTRRGRLVFLEARGLFRLEDDGTLHALGAPAVGAPGFGPFRLDPDRLIAAGKNGAFLVVTQADSATRDAALPGAGDIQLGTPAYAFYRVQEGTGATPLFYQTADPFDYAELTFTIAQIAWDGGAAAYAITRTTGTLDDAPPVGWQLAKFDLATGAKTPVQTFGGTQPVLDAAGNLYALDAGGALHVQNVFTQQAVAIAAPAGFKAPLMLVGTDGKLYSATGNEVFRVDAAGATRVVGNGELAASSDALAFFFQELGGLLPTPNGLLIGDIGAGQIYQLGADNKVLPKLAAKTFSPGLLRLDPAGGLHAFGPDAQFFGSVDASGKWTQTNEVTGLGMDFLYAADGTLYYTSWDYKNRTYLVSRQKNGQTTQLLNHNAFYSIALDEHGKLLVAGEGVLRRLDGDTLTDVKADAAFELPGGLADAQALAVDAKGRVYVTRADQHAILRFDPATGATTTFAGVGGKLFTGSTVDAGIKHPTRPVFTANGDLYFVDTENRQVKIVAAGDL